MADDDIIREKVKEAFEEYLAKKSKKEEFDNADGKGKSQIANEYVRDVVAFDDKPATVKALNVLFDGKGPFANRQDKICSPDRIYDDSEIFVYLLKRLQAGENTDLTIVRADLADELGISPQSLDKYLLRLKSSKGLDILGSKVKIDELRHGKNTYDHTIHPVFLALNLTEVYFLTVKLPSLVKKDQKETALGIVGDVYRQLSDYAKAKMDHFFSKESRKEQLKGIQVRGYRNEKKDILYYEKSGEMCSIELKDKGWLSGIILKGDDNSHYKLQKNNGEVITFTADDRISGPLQ